MHTRSAFIAAVLCGLLTLADAAGGQEPAAGASVPMTPEARTQLYQEIERFRAELKRPGAAPAEAGRRQALVQRWLDLVIDEGALNPGGLYGVVPLPRDIADGLKRTGDSEAAARQLDAFTGYWHADGSLGNIRKERWKDVEVASFSAEGAAVRLACTAGQVPANFTLRIYRKGVIRVTGDTPGFFGDETLEPDTVVVRDGADALTVEASWGEIRITKRPFGVRVAVGGKTLWEEAAVQVLPDGGRVKAVRQRARLAPEDRFYGFGERYRQLDYRGAVLTHWQSPSTPSIMRGKYADTYAPVAFAVNPRGMGLFWNSSYRGQFDLGASEAGVYKATFSGPVYDCYLFFGATPPDVIARYTDLTGKPLLPPEWALKPQMGGGGSRWTLDGRSKTPLAEAEKEVRKMLGLGFPLGSIYIESFGNSASLADLLRTNGVRWIAWNCPGFFDPLKDGAELGLSASEAEKLALQRSDGTRFKIPETRFLAGKPLIDFTHPRAGEMVLNLEKARLTRGFRGGMLDDGDDVPPDARFHDGLGGEEMHGLYAYYYTRSFGGSLQKLTGGDCLHFARCAGAGSQSYVCQFLGDLRAGFNGLRENIRAGLSFSASGIPNWGGCIGGYSARPDKEVYLRWTQLACFTPLMRYHGHQPREPWYYDQETVEIYGYYAWLRVNLMPYLQAFMRETRRTGVPGVMPLALAYPADPQTYPLEDQYLFGPSMLVAPMVSSGQERSVYLPAGHWYPFLSGEAPLTGGRRVTINVPLKQTAVFVPEGSIIPLRLGSGWRLGGAVDKAETVYRLFPARAGRFTFRDGAIGIECVRDNRELRIKARGLSGRTGFWIMGTVTAARRQEKALPLLSSRAAFEQAERGLLCESRSAFVRDHFGEDEELVITLKTQTE